MSLGEYYGVGLEQKIDAAIYELPCSVNASLYTHALGRPLTLM